MFRPAVHLLIAISILPAMIYVAEVVRPTHVAGPNGTVALSQAKPAPSAAARQQVKGPGTFRVMTYNIHHGVDADDRQSLERIAQVIRAADPDVVFLSEVDDNWRRSRYLNQPDFLSQQTGLAYTFFAPALHTRSIFHTAPGRRARYGNAFLSKSPLAVNGAIPLARHNENEPRNVIFVDVTVGGRRLRVFGTHLSVHAAERRAQLAQIDSVLHSSPLPALFLGDLNTPPGSLAREAPFLASDPWIDSHTVAGSSPGFTFSTPIEDVRIDYIFTHIELIPYLTRVVVWPASASDHLPVIADFSFDAARPAASRD